jgi:hypothetical protein
MNKIVLNFDWKFNLPSVARFQFQIDLDNLDEYKNKPLCF